MLLLAKFHSNTPPVRQAPGHPSLVVHLGHGAADAAEARPTANALRVATRDGVAAAVAARVAVADALAEPAVDVDDRVLEFPPNLRFLVYSQSL